MTSLRTLTFYLGGVAVDGREDLPEGHAKMTDKLVGKTQKVSWVPFSCVDLPLNRNTGCWQDDAQA